MTEKTTQLLEILTTTIQQTKDFTIEQAPALAQEIVYRGRVVETFWLVLGVLGIMAAISTTVFGIKRENEDKFGAPFIAWISPKLYILETIAYMVRGK